MLDEIKAIDYAEEVAEEHNLIITKLTKIDFKRVRGKKDQPKTSKMVNIDNVSF